jgi:hypothetical protein
MTVRQDSEITGSAGVARLRINGPADVARRAGWWVIGLLSGAFGVFEAIKHGGPSAYLFFVGAIGPDIPLFAQLFLRHRKGQLHRAVVPWYNVLHFPLLPLVLIAFFSFYGDTNDQSAPGFTLGVAWLAHIAVDRAIGYGLRDRNGWQRGARRSALPQPPPRPGA